MEVNNFFRRREDNKAHPYPHNLSLSVLKYIHGLNTYLFILNNSAYLFYKNTTNPYALLQKRLNEIQIKEQTWEDSWKTFEKYVETSTDPSLQFILLSLTFAWDWYIDEIGSFVAFCETKNLSVKDSKQLQKLHLKPLFTQFEIINKIVNLDEIQKNKIEDLEELFLLRNLGAHTGWIVDDDYLQKTHTKKYQLGETVFLTSDIICPYYANWIELINKLAEIISLRYRLAPDYTKRIE